MSQTGDAVLDAIGELAREAAARCGVEVVEVIYRRQGRHSVVRVDIDRPGLRGVGLADCEAVSRTLEQGLDALEALRDAYELQVSSPGLDRPIRTSDDIRRNTGRVIVVETRELVDGSRLFQGVLVGEHDGSLRLALDGGGEATIPLATIQLAHQDLDLPRRPPKSRR